MNISVYKTSAILLSATVHCVHVWCQQNLWGESILYIKNLLLDWVQWPSMRSPHQFESSPSCIPVHLSGRSLEGCFRIRWENIYTLCAICLPVECGCCCPFCWLVVDKQKRSWVILCEHSCVTLFTAQVAHATFENCLHFKASFEPGEGGRTLPQNESGWGVRGLKFSSQPWGEF